MTTLTPFEYRRIDHFKEWIRILFQEKPGIKQIITKLWKLGKLGKDQITHQSIKIYLKSNKLSKLYEYIPDIYNSIHGIPNPVMTPVLKNILILMFEKIQKPFQKHTQRKSFFSYNYTIYKFLELLGQHQLLKHITVKFFPSHDEIFAKICKDLNWPSSTRILPSIKPLLLRKKQFLSKL